MLDLYFFDLFLVLDLHRSARSECNKNVIMGWIQEYGIFDSSQVADFVISENAVLLCEFDSVFLFCKTFCKQSLNYYCL